MKRTLAHPTTGSTIEESFPSLDAFLADLE